jgi:DNA repair ATPase RecN
LDKVEGTGNKFIIDAKAQNGFDGKVETIQAEIKQTQIKIEKVIKQIKLIKKKIHSEKENTQKIYLRIKELTAAKTKPPASLVAKMRENQNRIKEHNLLLKELKDAKIHNETLTEDMKNLQSSVFEAKVINNSSWKEFNEVTFKIIEPPVDAVHLLHEGEIAREIKLQALEDGEFILNRKG